MSENRDRDVEREFHAIQQAIDLHHRDMRDVLQKLEVTLTQVAVALKEIGTHDSEIKTLRATSHDHGNRLALVSVLERRMDKLERHEEEREAELKDSFARRDIRIGGLAKIVYIGVGIALVSQLFVGILVSLYLADATH